MERLHIGENIQPQQRVEEIDVFKLNDDDNNNNKHVDDVAVTPPLSRHHPSKAVSTDTDSTLSQAAKCLSLRANQKKAPMPPTRTSSFKDQANDGSSMNRLGIDDSWMMISSMTNSFEAHNLTNESFSDHIRSQSSSDDLLSTSASQSRSASLERILEHCRGQSSAGQMSADQSAEDKTPDTDISDTSFPPPPPSLLDDIGQNPTRFSRSTPRVANDRQKGELVQSLRKTTRKSKDSLEDAFVDSGHSSPAPGSYGGRLAVRSCVTMPRASVGLLYQDELLQVLGRRTSDVNSQSKVDSAENRLSESCSNLSEMVFQMPTPEVRRKVEEWQAGVERSLTNPHSGDAIRDQIAKMLSSQRRRDDAISPEVSADSIVKPPPQQSASTGFAFQKSPTNASNPSGEPEARNWTMPKLKPVSKVTLAPKFDIQQTGNMEAKSNQTAKQTGNVEAKSNQTAKPAANIETKSNQTVNQQCDAISNLVVLKKIEKVGKTDSALERSVVKDETPPVMIHKKWSKPGSQTNKETVETKLPVSDTRPSLPGLKPIFPGHPSSQLAISEPSSLRKSLHHVSPDQEDDELVGENTMSKESVLKIAVSVSQKMKKLNLSSNKHSSAVIQITEDLQLLHRVCSSFVETLPPHCKFQFREMLSALESATEGLKLTSGLSPKEYDKHLSSLQTSLKGIEDVLRR